MGRLKERRVRFGEIERAERLSKKIERERRVRALEVEQD